MKIYISLPVTGCDLEHEAARIYQKQQYYSLDEIKTIKI